MVECLGELAEQMTERNLSVGKTSVHGSAIENQNLLYISDHQFRQHPGIVEDSIAVMTDLSEDTDPSPLFLVKKTTFSAERPVHNPQKPLFSKFEEEDEE